MKVEKSAMVMHDAENPWCLYQISYLNWCDMSPLCAGGSGPAPSWPGTTTTRWEVWRAKCCSAAAGPPSAEDGCCDPKSLWCICRKLRRTLFFDLFVFLSWILNFITTDLFYFIHFFLYIWIKCKFLLWTKAVESAFLCTQPIKRSVLEKRSRGKKTWLRLFSERHLNWIHTFNL